MKLKKIISGGQTGADLAGLHAATALGIKTGGTAPKGYRICLEDGRDGSNSALATFGLVEHSSREYSPRTKQNVADSDGTVWFGYQYSPGGKLTLSTAEKLGKPAIVNPTSEQLKSWLTINQIKVLNVSGNRKSSDNPTIFEDTYNCLIEALKGEV